MGKEQRALTQGWCHMYDGLQPWPFSQSPHNCKKLTEKGNSKLVLCLFLRIAKEADDECYIDPCKDPHESIILANSIPAEACHSYQANTIAVASCGPLQCCNVCGVYADVNSLPPCLCSIREGL